MNVADRITFLFVIAAQFIFAELTKAADTTDPIAIIPVEPYLRFQSVVRADVGGQQGTFLFDTGEGVSCISPELADKIGCHPWGQITGFRMSGERLTSQHCDQVTFNLAGHAFTAASVGIQDIMKLMGPDVPHLDGVIGLDLFAGRVITIVPRKSLIIESEASLAARIVAAKELPVRLVRDVEGLSLCVDAAVPTPAGMAWMELDSGNGGSLVVADHLAPLLGLKTEISEPIKARFRLANGIEVEGTTRTRDLIMDGNIGAQFLNNWILTLDLQHSRAWLAPSAANAGERR